MKENSVDLTLLAVTIVLVGIGVVMVYSSSSVVSEVKYQDSSFFLKKHLIIVLLGTSVMILAALTDYSKLSGTAAISLLLLGFLLLVLVLMPKLTGEPQKVCRWIHIGRFNFQPSEFMKLALIIYMADSLARRQDRIKSFVWGFLPHLLILLMAVGLIILEPALGTAVAIMTVVTAMFFLAGIKLLHLGGLVLAAVPVIYLSISQVGYRLARLKAFLHPAENLQGMNYQTYQSLVALGSGGLRGLGLGHSRQKFLFLPAPHTDFIYSIIGEEWGFIGTVAILFLFLLFIWRGLKIAHSAPDLRGFLLASGLTIMIATYAAVNIGVATGVCPTTGLPLPFISYGGSSLLVSLASTGILLSISRKGKQVWQG
ncbi:MAG: putative lipid II flippase FtsW [Candidatus Latescibacteria bacterium]|nr:putative lipid II flippase FtsW [Candidatus Latescibacterota bacterium]